ncbi:hypothetical protein GCM10010922_21590 [Microbacterium sorbitolivorans]|nr:hypothetical protein GCM10010922_21590 [Microbacterium sorbitolivorans]
MRRFMPTNIALDALRTRRGLKWGVPAMLLAVVYMYAASVMTTLIEGGGPEWLYLVMLVCIWNALKFIVHGPVSLIQLARVRVLESRGSPMNGRRGVVISGSMFSLVAGSRLSMVTVMPTETRR